MSLKEIARGVQIASGAVEIEVSGGIKPEMIRPLAEIGVDRISVGALTHSAPSADLHMKLTTVS
jgi:nicotinate-nucleotide pyrophosphorylase (carboxylating)